MFPPKPELQFYDSASPENIPSGVHAGVYVNGFKWSQAEINRMSRVFRISVQPEATWGKIARCLDIERGAANPNNLPPFIAFRKRYWPNTTAYVNRGNWDQCIELVLDSGEPIPRWWVATLDGTRYVETTVRGKVYKPWAVQYRDVNNAFDLSVLYGANDFVKP